MEKLTFYGGGDFLVGDVCFCAWSETSLGCCGCVNLPGRSAQPGAAEPCCALPSSHSHTFGPSCGAPHWCVFHKGS